MSAQSASTGSADTTDTTRFNVISTSLTAPAAAAGTVPVSAPVPAQRIGVNNSSGHGMALASSNWGRLGV